MASTVDLSTGIVQLISLEQIRHDCNIREHDVADVEALAGSIELLGQITPAIVRPDGDGYVLVAGHKRYAALQRLGRCEIRAEIRSVEAEQSERAAENIVRTQLNPYEEARAVQAMLAEGLSQDGAAQALGWSKARVSARMRLLQLPARAQEMVGAGTIALSAIDPLLRIAAVSPPLLDAVIAYLADGNAWVAERLAREPGWVLDSALRQGDSTVFAEHLSHLDTQQIAQLRLGKKTDALVEEATRLHKQLDRYAYSASFRFGEKEIDQARAAGVLIEFERSAPIIVDRPLYRELAKQTIRRTVEELTAKVTARDAERTANRRRATAPDDLVGASRREHQRQLRELAETAHGVNLDIGQGLMTGLSSVDPSDLTVARFFVYALLGNDYDSSPYTQAGERVAALAVSGIRLVMGEFRSDVTKTKKDGSRGKLRIDYGDPRDPAEPIKWLWKFIDGARTAGELYGRALVVIAAEQYASRLVLARSQQHPPTRWSSHKDHASKALAKLAGPHLPATLKQLEKAITKAQRDHETATSHPTSSLAARASESIEADEPSIDETGAEELDDPANGAETEHSDVTVTADDGCPVESDAPRDS